ncbi:MAG: zinc ribbon domain-containing protein [Spirochaetales bacterium]|nr:zinc ribbon domain-containing protein [Spirochaetales bacterium]
MPTYDYECRSCGHRFETFQSMSDDALVQCPECKKDELRRLIGGGSGIIFKGSGFYVNDSKKGSSSGSPKGQASA